MGDMEAVQISERESKVLKELVEVYRTSDEGTCRYIKYIAADVGLDYSQTRRAVRSLARKGLAEYHRGLFNDDGMVAGSGYCATKEGEAFFKEKSEHCKGGQLIGDSPHIGCTCEEIKSLSVPSQKIDK